MCLSKGNLNCLMIVRSGNSNELCHHCQFCGEQDVPGEIQMVCLNDKADYANRLACLRALLIDL